MMVAPITVHVPQSPEGFYAINNPFQVDGPKGHLEFKKLENDDMFIRFDMPGVRDDGVTVVIDKTEKAICIIAEAPKEHKHDSSPRIYTGTKLRPKLSLDGINTKIACKCLDFYFYSSFTTFMSDGVLRLILTKTYTDTPPPPCIAFLGGASGKDPRSAAPHVFPDGTDPHDPNLTGRVLMPHPCISQGSQMAYESKVLQNGGLYVRVDMPGVPSDNFKVTVTNGRVKVTGQAPALSHDSSGRFYSGDVAILSTPVDIPARRIKTIAKNGVIRLIIPPL